MEQPDETIDSLTPESFSLGENMELITMIPGIGDEISALVTHIGKLEMMCADLVNKVADVKKENEALKTDISTFQDNEKRFEGLSSRMEFMADQLNATGDTIKSTNESSSKTIQALEASLEVRLAEIEKQAASTRESLSTRFDDVSSRVVSVSSRISNASVDIGCVSSDLEGVTRRLALLESLSVRVEELSTQVALLEGLSGRVTTLEGLSARITTLEEQKPITLEVVREIINEASIEIETSKRICDPAEGFCCYNQTECSLSDLQDAPVEDLGCCDCQTSDNGEYKTYKTYTCSVCSGECSEGEMCCVGTLTKEAILAAQPKPPLEASKEQVETKEDFSCHDSGEDEDLGPVHTPTPPPTPEHSSESGEPKEQEVTEDSVTPSTELPIVSTPSETVESEFVVGTKGTEGNIDELEVEEISTYDVDVTNGKLFHYGKARLDVSPSSWTLTVSEPFEEVQRGEELHLTVKDFEWKPTLAGIESSSDDTLAFNFDLLLDGDDTIIVTGKRNVYTNLTFSLAGK